ncbi:MAG: tyrosine--tRNA ligase [Planctomycetota bacterium]
MAEEKRTLEEEFKPDILKEVDRQVLELSRATAQVVPENALRRRLAVSLRDNLPLRVKLGVDPTAHDLHLGFTVPLNKLRLFSDFGHTPVLIIGDATAMVGDPSGRNKARPTLTRELVDDFASSYLDQAAKVLDMSRVEVRRNSEWLHKLGFVGFIQLAAQATVAQILVREDFDKRFKENAPIYLHELIYPLMQGHDSVVVKADVELGGQDQLFNLLVGRDLQQADGQEPQICMMGHLLVGLDGSRKMSKSFDNYIGVTDEAKDMFGKIMSLPDEVMREWFEYATKMPLPEITSLFASNPHPRELKDRLARRIVERYHDAAAADAGAEHFRRVFSNKELPEDLPAIEIAKSELDDGKIWIAKLLVLAGFAKSNGEASRLVKQGGVKINRESATDPKAAIGISGGEILQVGKKRFGQISLL